MFSANENIALRQYKKQVVEYVESCIPEEALDMGTMVMAMQVSCKAPGCVPLETAIVIVFPKLDQELIPGLPESCGGNYKTKVLKPMSQVTREDVLEALPPEFPGGKRSLEKLCLQARDVMLGQITQLFAEEDQKGRQLMAEYLQQCLKEYIERGCTPPEWGEPFPDIKVDETKNGESSKEPKETETTKSNASTTTSSAEKGVTKTGNFVFKRPKDSEPTNPTRKSQSSPSTSSSLDAAYAHSSTAYAHSSNTNALDSKEKSKTSQSIIEQLGERQHAPGIRKPGCPCCDPDSANTLIDEMMAL
jgi:hypothetical protein